MTTATIGIVIPRYSAKNARIIILTKQPHNADCISLAQYVLLDILLLLTGNIIDC